MTWILLAVAIVLEVCATLSLRMATTGRAAWYAAALPGYVIAFTFLSLALSRGLGIGVAYGIWAAAGVALTAIASKFLFGEAVTRVMAAGIALIVAGVLLIELGGAH